MWLWCNDRNPDKCRRKTMQVHQASSSSHLTTLSSVQGTSSNTFESANVTPNSTGIEDFVSQNDMELKGFDSSVAANSVISAQYCDYLKSIKDNWSSCHAAKYLSKELIRYLEPRFQDTSTPLKVRILTSFLYMKDNLREECCNDIIQILSTAETDANEWVKKMGRMLFPFVKKGAIDLQETDTETAYRIINFLDTNLTPPAQYIRKSGLEAQHICDPHSEIKHIATQPNVIPTEALPTDEYRLFMARENFDLLLSQIIRNGKEEMHIAMEDQNEFRRMSTNRKLG